MPRDAILVRNHNHSLKGISNEHAHLIGLLDELKTCAGHKPVNRDVFAAVLGELCEELRGHFKHEEELMLQIGYVKYLDHAQDHTLIIGQIENLSRKYKASTLGLEAEVLRRIDAYKDGHLENFDREMVILFSEKY